MRSSPTGEGRSKGPFEKSTDREREIRQEPQHNISKKYQRLWFCWTACYFANDDNKKQRTVGWRDFQPWFLSGSTRATPGNPLLDLRKWHHPDLPPTLRVSLDKSLESDWLSFPLTPASPQHALGLWLQEDGLWSCSRVTDIALRLALHAAWGFPQADEMPGPVHVYWWYRSLRNAVAWMWPKYFLPLSPRNKKGMYLRIEHPQWDCRGLAPSCPHITALWTWWWQWTLLVCWVVPGWFACWTWLVQFN